MSGNIILIGFMGVGKGRTARALAEYTGMFAVDTDDLIESFTNTKIRKIFSQQGEASFRILEQQTAVWLHSNVRNTIVSTGGGFFNVKKLNSLGTVVYLHSTVESIFSALLSRPNAEKQIKKRPLLKDMDQAKQLFSTRLPRYRKLADLEVSVENREIGEVAVEIAEKLSLSHAS